MTKTMTKDELDAVLERHAEWLRGDESGARADLTGAVLTDADLTRAYLTGADLRGAYLTDADLTGANLTAADLTGTILEK